MSIIKFFSLVSWLAFGAEESHLVLVISDLKFKYFVKFFALVLGPSNWGDEGPQLCLLDFSQGHLHKYNYLDMILKKSHKLQFPPLLPRV